MSDECSWWSTDNEHVLGVVIFDRTDKDYLYVALGRDKIGRYRAFTVGGSYFTRRQAEEALATKLDELRDAPAEEFHQGDEVGAPLDVLTPVVAQDKLHPNFRQLVEGKGFSAARDILREMGNVFEDKDGNFVRDFQTTGFNARLWELYLFAVLVEEGFTIHHEFSAPDFTASIGPERVCIEAVTVNPSERETQSAEVQDTPSSPETIKELLKDYMPIKFGSPLYSKLQMKYWELDHVKGAPLIFAVADFHAPRSMMWSGSALSTYLYGIRYDVEIGEDGVSLKGTKEVEEHTYEGKTIPSNFFGQPDTENISAVMFTNAGTLPKFNRMGVLAGYGAKELRLIRRGLRLAPGEETYTPIQDAIDIEHPRYDEGWADEIQIFHNPNALHPLDRILFPNVHHHFREGDKIKSYGQPFSWLGSVTLNVWKDDAKPVRS